MKITEIVLPKCPKCGAEDSIESNKCVVCGEHMIKIYEYATQKRLVTIPAGELVKWCDEHKMLLYAETMDGWIVCAMDEGVD